MSDVAKCWALAVALMTIVGCLNPRLNREPVARMSEAQRRARNHAAYDRARERIPAVKGGMSPSDVEVAMGAVLAVEQAGDKSGPERTLMDGFLCKVAPSPLTERWLFGYDEGNVLLVGFAVEFGRDKPDSNDWTVRRVERSPADDCPIVGDTRLE